MRLVAFVHDKRSGVGKLTEEGSATVPFALGSEVEKGTLAVLQRDEPTEIQSTILPLAEVELLVPLAASRFPTRCIRQYHIEGVLVEGDIIATGTPAGVGIGFDPPEYLTDGDQVRIEIEGIGVLTNPVIVNGGGG